VTAPKPPRYPRSSPGPLDQPYWDGLAAGEVRVQRCADCGARQWYPRPMCTRCYSFELAWERIDPHGAVLSFTVTHQRTGFAFDLDSPFTVAVVQFAADPDIRMAGRLVGLSPAEVAIGLPVRGFVTPVGTEADAPVALQFGAEGRL
jgi:uncharacterized protein